MRLAQVLHSMNQVISQLAVREDSLATLKTMFSKFEMRLPVARAQRFPTAFVIEIRRVLEGRNRCLFVILSCIASTVVLSQT